MALFRGEGDGSVPRSVVITVPTSASSVDSWVFIADRAYNLVAVRENHSVVGGAAAATRLRKVTATGVAPGAAAGATVIELIPSLDLTATANTTVTPVITVASVGQGDRLGLDFSGTLTGLVGVVQIELQVA